MIASRLVGAARCPIKYVRANLANFDEAWGPIWRDIIGVVMGCTADRGPKICTKDTFGDGARILHNVGWQRAFHSAVTSERKLTAGLSGRSLKHDAAHAFRVSRVTGSIKYYFGNGLLTGNGLEASFIGNRKRKTLCCAFKICGGRVAVAPGYLS